VVTLAFVGLLGGVLVLGVGVMLAHWARRQIADVRLVAVLVLRVLTQGSTWARWLDGAEIARRGDLDPVLVGRALLILESRNLVVRSVGDRLAGPLVTRWQPTDLARGVMR
jgi:hypothetical protein